MFDFLCVTGLFFATALTEIVGCCPPWLWRVDSLVLTRWDPVGGAICLAGMVIMALQPRAAGRRRGRS